MKTASEQKLAFSVAIGAPRELIRLSVDKDGLPTALLVLPRDSYATDYGTFKTPEKVLRRVLAAWKERGLPLPIDYEHQSAQDPPVVAPAAGLAYKLEIRKEGLVATSIKWTRRAKAMLVAQGEDEVPEYNFHSPVFLFDKKTMEPTRLISLALTNTPASHNQDELRAQVAARIDEQLCAAAAAEGKGGKMKELVSALRYALGMRLTDSMKDLRAALEKILAKIPDTDDMIAEMRAGEGEAPAEDDGADLTIATLLGLIEKEEAERLAKASTGVPVTAAPEVLTLLGVDAGADLASIVAAVVALKSPADMVPRAELETLRARIAELDASAAAARIDELIAANRTRVTPAMEADIRELARTNFELAKSTVAKLPEQKPAGVASAPAPKGLEARSEARLRGGRSGDGEREPTSARGAEIRARVEAIMAEKGVSYFEANEIRKKEEAASAA